MAGHPRTRALGTTAACDVIRPGRLLRTASTCVGGIGDGGDVTDNPDEIEVPEDAGEYADALAAILKRIPEHWGRYLSVDPGWYPLLTRLDAQLAALDPEYEIHQVKEKFGGLRYYTHTGAEGSVREQFSALIDAAEAEAARTCERCGARGTLHRRYYLVKTLCSPCSDALSDDRGRFEPVGSQEGQG